MQQLESILNGGPFFEGLPFIDYENKDINWADVSQPKNYSENQLALTLFFIVFTLQ